jgi:hypothetical protein
MAMPRLCKLYHSQYKAPGRRSKRFHCHNRSFPAQFEIPEILQPTEKGEMFRSSYGPLEKALAIAYGVPESVRETSLRGWVTNLQKLGLLGKAARVGRGTALVYTPNELHRLICGLELTELGVPPATAVALVDAYWESKIKAIFALAEETVAREEPPENDVILHLGGVSLRSGAWSGARIPGIPNINRCRLRELPNYIVEWMKMGPNDPIGLPPRALVVNLSARLRAFHTAFAKSYLDEALTERAGKIKSTRKRKRK